MLSFSEDLVFHRRDPFDTEEMTQRECTIHVQFDSKL